MPAIERTVKIKADPDAVFALISRVEDFSRYSRVIKEVRAIGPNTYRWVIGVAGLELDWDSRVTVAQPPHRFAWNAIRGVDNRGAFKLKPVPGGTEVRFTMEYRLANPLLDRIVETVARPLMHKVAAEILEHVRRRLEVAPAGAS
jgi:uncharacterized membrane protein